MAAHRAEDFARFKQYDYKAVSCAACRLGLAWANHRPSGPSLVLPGT